MGEYYERYVQRHENLKPFREVSEDKIPDHTPDELQLLKDKWFKTMTKLTMKLGQFDRKTIKARAEYLRLFKKELDRKNE